MKNYVPYEKMSKKAQKEFNAQKRSDNFGMSMVTKVVIDQTKYNRKKLGKVEF